MTYILGRPLVISGVLYVRSMQRVIQLTRRCLAMRTFETSLAGLAFKVLEPERRDGHHLVCGHFDVSVLF
jgi:hypothetical protein